MNMAYLSPQECEPDDVDLSFQLAGVGLCISRQHVIRRCNQVFADMFGYQAGELAGTPLANLHPSASDLEGGQWLGSMLESGRYSDERIMRRKDGSLFWCQMSGRPLHPERPLAGAVWVFEDRSERRPAERVLTGREREVAKLLVSGKSSKEVGRILAISPRTADAYRARLIQKFEVRSRLELISSLLSFTSLGA